MTLNGWKRTEYDERFEMLYSSIITHNSSWSQTAMSLTRSVRHLQSNTVLSSSGGFSAPVLERSGRCSRSQEAKSSHNQSIPVRKRTSQSWNWPDRDPGKYGRAGRGLEAQGQRRGTGWREMLKGSAGSETSIVISDEGTDWEVLEEGDGGRMTSSPIKVGNPNVDRLWILEDDDGFQDREHETHGQEYDISILNIEQDEVLEFVGVVGDTDHCSDSSSTASGPTLSADFTLQSACPTCAKLFKKMRKLKHWKKSIEYDPMSLSCDQWVSTKIWRPRTLSNKKGKLWTHLSRLRKSALSSIEAGEMLQPKTSCSRPHVFLHRNLLQCKRKEALDHRKPCHMKTTVDRHQRAVRVSAKESRRKRKLCEMEPQWEEPQEEGQLHAHCTSSSSHRGEEAALNVHEENGSEVKNRARRKLECNGVSVTQDPQRQYEKPQSQKTTQQDIKTDAHCTSLTSAAKRSKTFKPSPVGGPLDHCPWVQGGGFRSMLAELEGNRNMVVQELAHLSVNKLN